MDHSAGSKTEGLLAECSLVSHAKRSRVSCSDESDVKKDGTYCRMCKKCREKRSVCGKKRTFSINIFYVVVVGLITNDIIKDI
jgi:hypothetical protein